MNSSKKFEKLKDDEKAGYVLQAFQQEFTETHRVAAKQELIDTLAKGGFELVNTYNVGETQAFLPKKTYGDQANTKG